jgi:hypothetical protein
MLRSIAAVALFVSACSGSSASVNPTTASGEGPDWANQTGVRLDKKESIVYGVGIVSGIRNLSLARSTADNRARNEIAKFIEVYSASLMKDYQGSVTAGDFSATSEEQSVENAIKTVTVQTLNGVEIVDHWRDPVDGSIYALARMDLERFADFIDRHQELSAAVKAQVKKSAERALADLEAEELKRQ